MVRVKCEKCGTLFDRPIGQYREAIKFKWRQFCSFACQSKAKSKKITRICCNPFCSKKIYTRKKVGHAFCSLSCNAIYKNSMSAKPVKLRKCALQECNQYIKNKNSKYCSNKCSHASKKDITSYSATKLIELIETFFEQYSRIPTKSEMGHLNRPARKFFGTWNNMIKAAGFEPNPVRFSNHFIANDGHKCDSLSEKIVDDWLFARKISHQVKVKYPWNNGMTADFKVGNYWIELFGLTGQLKTYDQLMKIKLEKIKEYDLNLICLFLSDLFPKNHLEDKLSILRKRTTSL